METTGKSPPSLARVIACWVALVATIVCNGLFETLRLGGVTAAEVSNQVFTWFMPAGYVFSIWGVIYTALVIWMIAETKRAMNGDTLERQHVLLFVMSCVLNVCWLIAFHFQEVGMSLAILAALWIDLALLYMGLRDEEGRSKLNLAPFSLYFAWSTVAVIVNATNLATRLVESPLIAHQVSTILLTLAVLGVAYLSIRNSRDIVFPLVVIWALVGVGVHLLETDIVIATAVFGLTAIGALIIYAPGMLASKKASRKSRT